jgi:hypothetical protein
MFLKPTPQLLQQIKDSGKPLIKLSMDEFQKIASDGKLLKKEDVVLKVNSTTPSNISKKLPPANFLPPTKVRVYESIGKGLGVFATEKILKGEIIETCHLITLNVSSDSTTLEDYRFMYPKNTGSEFVIPLGLGCIYNHSNTPNADWADHPEWRAFNFVSIRDIEEGEEICTYYGGEEYWSLRPHTKVI